MRQALSEIDGVKNGYKTPLGGILKYSNSFVNETYFGDVDEITPENIDLFLRKIEGKINEVKKLKEKVFGDDTLSEAEKKYLLNTLNGVGIKFLIMKYSALLEAEKGGFKLDENERKRLLKKVNRLQDIAYGIEISKNPKEQEEIIEVLGKIFQKNKGKLTQNEVREFEKFLKSFGWDNNTFIENEEKIDDLTKIILSPEEVKEIMDIIIVFYGLEIDGWISEINEKEGNFSINYDKKSLMIPTKSTSLKRVCELIDHEIGVHMIRGRNTQKTLVAFGEGYLEGEEGLATIGESLMSTKLDGISLEPTVHHISTFIAENYNGEETENLLRIYFKLTKKAGIPNEVIEKDAKDRVRRVKRFVSFFEKGANRKDVTYTRGITQVNDILNGGNVGDFLRDFYFSKLSLDDLKLVPEFRESLGIDEDDLKFPVWIGKILYRGLRGENFVLDKVREEDPRFSIVGGFSEKVSKEVAQILALFKDIKRKKQ